MTEPRMCSQGWQIRLAFLDNPTDANRNAWAKHVNTCPECKRHFEILDEIARKIVQPELTIDQINEMEPK